MNIQWVRLDDDLSEFLNRIAQEQRRRVSEMVNEILREHVDQSAEKPEHPASGSQSG